MKSESIPVGQYQILNSKPLVLSVPTDLLETERMDIEYYQPHFIEMQNRVNQSGLDLPTLDTLRDPKRVITDGIREHVKTSSGVILIRTQNFGDPTLNLEDCVYVDHDQHSAAKKSAVRSGDLLIAIRGYLGKAVIVTNDVPEANINQHIACISVNPHCADSGYLWAFFTSPTGTTQLERQVTGTVQQGIMLPSLRRLPVPLPPRPVQEYIGAKVRLAERCRLQARELWKNSEAILADALGMSLDSANYDQIDKAQLRSADYQLSSVSPVAAWVTSSMVNGAISPQYFHPRRTNVILKLRSLGVEIKRLAELAIRRSDRVTPEQANGLSWYVGLAEIESATGYFDPVPTQRAEILGSSTAFKAGDILFSKLRPYLNKVSICPSHLAQGCGSTELLVYRCRSFSHAYYLFFVIKSNIGLYQIIDTTAGSTLPRVDPEIIDDLLIPIIPQDKQRIIDNNVRKVFALRYWAAQLVQCYISSASLESTQLHW